ncbi:MAG: hypothetical protein ACI8QT_000718 [Halioglobus sp.]|jgi:hypothetical protein
MREGLWRLADPKISITSAGAMMIGVPNGAGRPTGLGVAAGYRVGAAAALWYRSRRVAGASKKHPRPMVLSA